MSPTEVKLHPLEDAQPTLQLRHVDVIFVAESV